MTGKNIDGAYICGIIGLAAGTAGAIVAGWGLGTILNDAMSIRELPSRALVDVIMMSVLALPTMTIGTYAGVCSGIMIDSLFERKDRDNYIGKDGVK